MKNSNTYEQKLINDILKTAADVGLKIRKKPKR